MTFTRGIAPLNPSLHAVMAPPSMGVGVPEELCTLKTLYFRGTLPWEYRTLNTLLANNEDHPDYPALRLLLG